MFVLRNQKDGHKPVNCECYKEKQTGKETISSKKLAELVNHSLLKTS